MNPACPSLVRGPGRVVHHYKPLNRDWDRDGRLLVTSPWHWQFRVTAANLNSPRHRSDRHWQIISIRWARRVRVRLSGSAGHDHHRIRLPVPGARRPPRRHCGTAVSPNSSESSSFKLSGLPVACHASATGPAEPPSHESRWRATVRVALRAQADGGTSAAQLK